MDPSFTTAFWGDQDKGIDVLIQRMKNGKHVTAEVVQLFKERAAIEEEFGKRLAKLAKAFTTAEEIGSLRESLDLVKSELETSARAHLDIANEIRLQLEKPVSDFLNQQSVVRKNHHANVERRLKSKANMTLTAQKARSRYTSKCQEVNQLLVPQPNLPPKDAEKHQLRLEKAQQQANQNDLEYMSSVERQGAAHAHWEEDYRVACSEFQKLEEERIDYLKGRLWAYANIISTLCVADDESCERIRGSLERCNVSKDISLFLDMSSTGTVIPPPLAYINFYTGTSERATSTGTLADPGSGPYLPRSSTVTSLPGPSSGPLSAGPGAQFSNFFKKTGPGVVGGGGAVAFGSLFRKSQSAGSSSGGVGMSASSSSDQIAGGGGKGPVAPTVMGHHDSGAAGVGVDSGEFSYDPYDFGEESPVMFEVRVLYDYQSQAFEELSVARGQIVPVIAQHEDGWWEGIVTENDKRRKGLFPSNFVERI
ncbi:hypothetical protein HDU98_007915 [Podochytrium sp. JEL0797]|nr:hypothetical protein HDU98_007915 [Podochytrium sp. JEL0797]